MHYLKTVNQECELRNQIPLSSLSLSLHHINNLNTNAKTSQRSLAREQSEKRQQQQQKYHQKKHILHDTNDFIVAVSLFSACLRYDRTK